jgi:hypothetical protein
MMYLKEDYMQKLTHKCTKRKKKNLCTFKKKFRYVYISHVKIFHL